MKNEIYVNQLCRYGMLFLFRMRRDMEFVNTLGLKFSQLDRTNAFLKEVSDLGCSSVIELMNKGVDPDEDIVMEIYKNHPHFKMNMMFGLAISKLMYGNDVQVLNLFELISIRSLCIQVSVNGECSVNSAMITALKIPVAEVPVEVVQISRSLDEYIKAVKLIEEKISKLDNYVSFPALSIYRDYIKQHAQKIILEVNDAGYYGTYPEYVFVEMIILRKLSPHQYPSLYGTPSLPRWDVPYDQLQQIVETAWRNRNDKD